MIGSAAVLAAYAAGYARTDAAAAELASRSGARRIPPASTVPDSRAAVSSAAEAAPAREPETQGAPAPSLPEPQMAAKRQEQPEANSSPKAPAQVVNTVSPVAADSAVAAVVSKPVSSAPTATSPAPAPAPAAIDSAQSSAVGWKDGTYSGWGTSRHGDVEATVIIENGRITAAAISRCLTRYSCSWIAHLQPQVAERQSPEIDNVSGATESANAFYYAVVEALKAAKR